MGLQLRNAVFIPQAHLLHPTSRVEFLVSGTVTIPTSKKLAGVHVDKAFAIDRGGGVIFPMGVVVARLGNSLVHFRNSMRKNI